MDNELHSLLLNALKLYCSSFIVKIALRCNCNIIYTISATLSKSANFLTLSPRTGICWYVMAARLKVCSAVIYVSTDDHTVQRHPYFFLPSRETLEMVCNLLNKHYRHIAVCWWDLYFLTERKINNICTTVRQTPHSWVGCCGTPLFLATMFWLGF